MGHIATEEAASLESHLAGCAACRRICQQIESEIGSAGRKPAPSFVPGMTADPNAASTRPEVRAGVAIPTELGGYRIVREIGRGGMGVVYLAKVVDNRPASACDLVHRLDHLDTAIPTPTPTSKPTRTWPRWPFAIAAVAPSGRVIATGNANGTVHLLATPYR